jgi:hypothetical protein
MYDKLKYKIPSVSHTIFSISLTISFSVTRSLFVLSLVMFFSAVVNSKICDATCRVVLSGWLVSLKEAASDGGLAFKKLSPLIYDSDLKLNFSGPP